MAGSELKFVISATDHASAVLAGVGKSTDQLDAKTRKLRAAAGLVSAGAIVAFGAASVKAYAEAEAQQVKLEEAYRKFPAVADVSIQSMRDLNSAIQAKTGSDDDELAAAEAKLAMYGLTGSQIQQLIPLVNDFAVAQGMGVTEAAQSVGKAMMGNAKALKGIGVDYKLTGDKARDFTAIMDALQGKVGGAGEAFGQTTAGQMKILQQSFSDLQEEVGAQLVPALKALVGVAKPILGLFGSLPDPLKSVTVLLGGTAAAALILGPRLLMIRAALVGLGPAGAGAAGGLTAEATAAGTAGTASATAATKVGLLGRALGPISIGITATVVAMQAWQAVLEKIGAGADGVNSLADAVKAQNAQAAEAALNAYSASQATSSWQSALGVLIGTGGAGFPMIVQGFLNAGDATKNLDQQLAQMVSQGSAASAASMIGALGMSADEARAKFPEYAKALDAAGKSAGDAAGPTGELASQQNDAAQAAEDHAAAVRDLKKALDDLGGKTLSVDGATADLYASFQKAQESIAKATEKTNANTDAVNSSRASLDLHTEAGQAAQGALADIAQKADDVATAMADAGAPTAAIKDKMLEARAAFIRAAVGAGLTKDAAARLADQYGLMPDVVETNIVASGVNAAIDAAQRVRGAIVSIPQTWSTTVVVVDQNGNNVRVPNLNKADGGYISGPGTSTSDSIPARLSNGEFVIRAASVQRLGVDFLNDLNDDGQISSRGVGVIRGARRAAASEQAQLLSHTVLMLDGKQIADALVAYKRQIGGRPLGLG